MKVINFFGGPGVGKSTIAAYVFSRLKAHTPFNVELITEYAKDCVYEGKTDILKNDQLYVFAKQNHKLKMIECYNKDVDFVINDSPLILSNIYGMINTSINEEFEKFSMSVFNSYENINFLIDGFNKFKYDESGRLQTKEEAENIHEIIKNYLDNNGIEYKTISLKSDLGRVFDEVRSFLVK
jgi:hypothetical protein